MAVMEFEHRPHRLRRDPAVVLDQPVDPLRAVGQQIFRGKPRSLDDGLAAALSGHGLDQRALGPVNVCHRRIVAQAVTRRQKTRLFSTARSAARCLGGLLRAAVRWLGHAARIARAPGAASDGRTRHPGSRLPPGALRSVPVSAGSNEGAPATSLMLPGRLPNRLRPRLCKAVAFPCRNRPTALAPLRAGQAASHAEKHRRPG